LSIGVLILGIITLAWVVITTPDVNKVSHKIAQHINSDSELSLNEKEHIEKEINANTGKITHFLSNYLEAGLEEFFYAKIENAQFGYIVTEPGNTA
jgi:hypothetical protein